MAKIDLNKLAAKLTVAEGLKKGLTIGQVKEVMKLVFKELKDMKLDEIVGILKRYK